jgi:release factor glutamine methyltransferase
MTLQEWLKKGAAELRRGPHPDRSRRDAETLLLHLLRRDRAALFARSKEVLSAEEAQIYVALLARRAAGEPIQYIVGETEFYGLPFQVAPGVLIPRPETEHLVEKAIELGELLDEPRIADIGCGSGAIAVALARHLPRARITAVDISQHALAVARENALHNGVAGRIRFLDGNLLAPIAQERFDIVASNPPYVPTEDRASLAVEVRDHEPAVALFAGNDGLDVIRRLIPDAHTSLAPGGWLVMEFGYSQSPAVGKLLANAGFLEIDFVSDLQGIPRVAVGRRP